jgi:siroheme synthase
MLPYGSVWLAGVADCDHRSLSPLAVQALGTADAVIHDPGVSKTILDLTKPSGYREAAMGYRASDRLMKLARDGWQVVHLVEDNTMERAVESAIRCAERNIPFCILPHTVDPNGAEAPLGLVLMCKTLTVGRPNPRSTLILLAASPQSEAELEIIQRQPPADFSMPGLAG